ncbi:MAG: PQQ-binding-like beta-propeller repeat protein [Planctomycetota bacterium]|nr:PQQ-binding-like beta-propeller repeat protein [Planctomycetota bacterium]
MRVTTAILMLAGVLLAQGGEVTLLTDEAISRYLRRGQQLAQEGQWAKVVDILQRVVEGDPKIFPDLDSDVLNAAVHSTDGFLFYPARELCIRELAKMPPEGIAAYRAAYDTRAKALLKKAEEATDITARAIAYAKVYDDHLVSSYGDDALARAAEINLDLGRYYEALFLLNRLIDLYPSDTDVDRPMSFAKAAYCAARIGNERERDRLLAQLASEYPRARIRLEGKLVATSDLPKERAFKVREGGLPSVVRESDWPVTGGDTSRTRVADDIPQTIARTPLWSFKISERDPRLAVTLRQEMVGGEFKVFEDIWRVVQHDRGDAPPPKPFGNSSIDPYPAVFPLVHDGIVFYKDYALLIARRVRSGRLERLVTDYKLEEETQAHLRRPEYRTPPEIVRPGVNDPSRGKRLEAVYRSLDYGGNALVVTAGRIVAVEPRGAPVNMVASGLPSNRASNVLVAYDRETGKTVWAWDLDLMAKEIWRDPAKKRAWEADYGAHRYVVFRGAGVASGGLLYTLVDMRDSKNNPAGVAVWAFDLQDGAVRFRTQLHRPDDLMQKLPTDATLAVAGGAVYATTSTGIVAALDALPPGRVRWIRRYERSVKKGLRVAVRRGGRGRGRAVARPEVAHTFALNYPIVAAGKVIVMAPDGNEMLVLHAEDGRIAWRIKRKDLQRFAYVVGVSNGVLVLAGSSVIGLDLADNGKVLWGPTPLVDSEYGRGFVGRRYAYIPTTAGAGSSRIHRYDLLTGDRIEPLEFQVPRLGNITYVGGRLLAATGDTVRCFSTIEDEIAGIDARLQAEGESARLFHERGEVQLLAEGGSLRARARDDLAKALELLDENDPAAKAIRQLALDNLHAIALAQSDLSAIDEARKIAKTPAYRAQTALVHALVLSQMGKSKEAFDELSRLATEFDGVEVIHTREVLTSRAAADKTRNAMLERSPEMRAEFERSVRGKIADALARGDVGTLQRIPDVEGRIHPAEEAYLALAQIHRNKRQPERAEAAFGSLIQDFPESPRLGEAYLRRALSLAERGLRSDARDEEREGLRHLDPQERRALAPLIDKLKGLLPEEMKSRRLPHVEIPLKSTTLGLRDAVPVAISGKVPAALEDATLLARNGGYLAVGLDGRLLWQAPLAGPVTALGTASDPKTVSISAAVARARLAVAVGEDLVLADAYGVMRLNAGTGKRTWAETENPKKLAAMFAAIRNDLERADKLGRPLRRRNRLARYAIQGNLLVRLHPERGVEGFDLDKGDTLWKDDAPSAEPVGAPRIGGGLIAVGWARPGLVRIYSLTGELLFEHSIKDSRGRVGGRLLAGPVVDRRGRLYMVTGTDDDNSSGELLIVEPTTGKRIFKRDRWFVQSPTAALLHVDDERAVFHDGGDLTNLHIIKFGRATASFTVPDVLPVIETIPDGSRLFVFTHHPGRSGAGARLFRLDMRGEKHIVYEHQRPAFSYARPVLTERYLAVCSVERHQARLALYDRDAAESHKPPEPVLFGRGATEQRVLMLTTEAAGHFQTAPVIVVSGKSLVMSTPFDTVRLSAPVER